MIFTLGLYCLAQMTLFKKAVVVGTHLSSGDIIVDDVPTQYHSLRLTIATENMICYHQPHSSLNLNLTRILETQRQYPVGSVVSILNIKQQPECSIINRDMVICYSFFYYISLFYVLIIGYAQIFLRDDSDYV